MDYHPFDANKLNKYVVVDDYTQTWEVRTGRPASTVIVLLCYLLPGFVRGCELHVQPLVLE